MSRETHEALEAHATPLDDALPDDPEQLRRERDALANRLEHSEQTCVELAERVRRYERERAEVRTRIASILRRMGAAEVG